MSRTEIMEHIVDLFSGFPPEIQEAIATGMALGKLEAAKSKATEKTA